MKSLFHYLGVLSLCSMMIDCGMQSDMSTEENFITGGRVAKPGEYPSVGKVLCGGGCTGTLIGTRTVLTAAHCILNANSCTFQTEDGRKLRASEVAVHPNWLANNPNENKFNYDVALLRFSSDISGITPTPINTTAQQVGQKVTLVGYGITPDGGYGTKRVGDNTISRFLNEGHKFAVSKSSGAFVDHGDSGGPAIAYASGQEVVSGICSTSTASESRYNVVTILKDWILENSGRNALLANGNTSSKNIALGKRATQSSTGWNAPASRAVDGNVNGDFWSNSVTHTANANAGNWWKVDLGGPHQVTSITIWNRTDCCSDRLSNFHVDCLDAKGNTIATRFQNEAIGVKKSYNLTAKGVYSVRVQMGGSGILSLAEVEVFGKISDGNGENSCVDVQENKEAILSCPDGDTITSIDFASYGLPVGSCDSSFQTSTCHSSKSRSKVESACLQKPTCTIKASNGVFGDPCVGKVKHLAIQYTCSTSTGAVGLVPLEYGAKNTFLVTMPLDATISWTELAFLSAVPAGMKVNKGSPSVIVVPPGIFNQSEREYYDNYLDRYKANFIYNIGQSSGLQNAIQIKSSSLDEVTCELARFWQKSDTVVMVNRNNYKLALSASAVAGRLKVPLFFFENGGASGSTLACLEQLGTQRVVAVGSSTNTNKQLQSADIDVISIQDDRAAISWLKNNGHPVDYFAVCNSGDRAHGYAPKSSLAAPLLAAARGGAVVPLHYPDSVFNDGCLIEGNTSTRPAGAANSADGNWRLGVCKVNGVRYDTVLSLQWADFGHNQGNIDLNHDGDFGDSGEFIKRGQVRNFGGKEFFIDINPRRLSGSFNKHWADVLFTYPTQYQIKSDIQSYHDALSHHPKYMVMIGLPDTLPVGLDVDTNGKAVTHFTDQCYADVDDDNHFDIAMGRIVGENASIFTLAASRAITYNQLLDGAWKNKAVAYGNFEDNSTMHQNMLNDAGFNTDRIPRWQDIDRTQYSIGVHDDHGWPFGFEPFTSGPIPPVFASTGGCSMGNIIDMIPLNGRLSEYKDFGAVKLARTGAVGFHAFSKNATANFDHVRNEYLNAILYEGATLGEAHLQSINFATTKFPAGSENIRAPMSYGDPALRLHVPGGE